MPDPSDPWSSLAPLGPVRQSLHEVIFEADTPAGKAFDLVLLVSIVASIVAVLLESVDPIRERHGSLLMGLEWVFTVLFTIEYALRLATSRRPGRYARSFFGVVDLLSILPTYVSLLLPGTQAFIVIRGLRLLRVFRVLKMARYVGESRVLLLALKQARPKITVFLVGVTTLVIIIGALMHLIEGSRPDSGFTSIPQSIYWAIVTMTTVGYGDISPQTVTGKFLASAVMIVGYGIIAVPTGIVTAELAQLGSARGPISTRACPTCSAQGHEMDAGHCKYCGSPL